MRLFYALFGALQRFQNSAIKWCSDHRRHHLKTDEEEDPYSVKKGFMWAHMGWVMVDQDEEIVEHVEDLQADRILAWQDRHIFLIGFLVGIVLPGVAGFMMLGGLHGFLGGMIYGGFLRVVIVHHATFLVNSIAPYMGHTTLLDGQYIKRFTNSVLLHIWRRLPQFPSHLPSRLSKWTQVVPLGSIKMVD